MTDRYKGFLVTLDDCIRDDDAEQIINALKMVKGVHNVKPYIAHYEDYMLYEKAMSDMGKKLMEFIRKECFGLKDSDKKHT